MNTYHKHHDIYIKSWVREYQLNFDQSYLRRCETLIKQEGDKQDHVTNIKCNMTDWHFIINEPHYAPLLEEIETIAESIMTDFKRYPHLKLCDCWGASYKKEEFAIPHNHQEAQVAFTYYIKAEDGSAPLHFFENMESPQPILEIQPKQNLLVLFNGAADHGVPPQKTDAERVVIAGNFLVSSPWET